MKSLREKVAAHQALGHAAAHDRLEQLAQQVTLAKTPMTVLGEGGVVRYIAVEAQPAEPTIGEVEVDLFA